jgi:sulfur carrier protein
MVSDCLSIVCNGEPRSIAAGTTVGELVAELGLNARHVAVELNQVLVPRARHADTRLAADDRLEVVTLVGGG